MNRNLAHVGQRLSLVGAVIVGMTLALAPAFAQNTQLQEKLAAVMDGDDAAHS